MRYEVTAVADASRVVTLPIDAADATQARLTAAQQGYAVVTVKLAIGYGLGFKRGRPFPLVLFSQGLRTMIEAGLMLPESLQALIDKETRGEHKAVLQQLLAAVTEGMPFSTALGRQPHVFPALFVATVRASERTGDLPEALARYLAYQGQIDALRKKVIAASVYPALLLCTGALVALFLLIYVVPRFSSVYESTGQSPPWLSGLLLSWGRFLDAHAAPTALSAAAMLAGLAYALARRDIRGTLLRGLWHFPRLGERLRIYDLARLYRTLAMLLRSGMPAVTALRTAAGLMRPEVQARLSAAVQSIEEGQSISEALAAHSLTTPVGLRMLRVGERSGRMSELMESIAAYLEDDTARWIEWFTRLFEPLIMLFIGAIIGLIVLLMYLPIFELAGGLR